MKIPDLGPDKWRDLPQNPLIAPPEGTSVVGDPQVILPRVLDGLWRMFITGEGHLCLYRGIGCSPRAYSAEAAASAAKAGRHGDTWQGLKPP